MGCVCDSGRQTHTYTHTHTERERERMRERERERERERARERERGREKTTEPYSAKDATPCPVRPGRVRGETTHCTGA